MQYTPGDEPGKAVETIVRKPLQLGAISEQYTKQLLVAGKGYDRTAINQFQDFLDKARADLALKPYKQGF